MHIICTADATLNGLGQTGHVYTDTPGGVEVWSDGSYTIAAHTDLGAVLYATGSVHRRGTAAATGAAAIRQINDDHDTDVVLDGTTIRGYSAA